MSLSAQQQQQQPPLHSADNSVATLAAAEQPNTITGDDPAVDQRANANASSPQQQQQQRPPAPPRTVSAKEKAEQYALEDAEAATAAAAADSPASASGPQGYAKGDVKVPLSKAKFVMVFVALSLSLFLAALDQTIVSTAIPTIAAEFNALSQIAWIGIAYLLTATAFSPTYGKLIDIFGRKPVFLAAVTIFEVGSAICGAAQNMSMLIIGRAIAGIGGGGIMSCILIIISDLVSFEDRGKYQGMLGGIFGLASVVGPLLGGYFTDNVSWRWCFYINLPIGGVALAVIWYFLAIPSPTGSVSDKLKRIDYLGTVLLISGIVMVLVPMQLGGGDWEWNSAKTIAFFVIGGVLLLAFVIVEIKVAVEPVIPGSVFENRSVPAIVAAAFCLGACFFSLVYYISLYFQIVKQHSATQAGIDSIGLIMAVSLFSIIGGQIISRTGYYLPFFFIGSTLTCLACALIATLDEGSSAGKQWGYLILAGTGVGSMIQTRIIGIQASVDVSRIAVATALVNFSQTLGGTVGLAISGTILNTRLTAKLADYAPNVPYQQAAGLGAGSAEHSSISPQDLPGVQRAFVESLSAIFIACACFAGAIAVFALFVKQYRDRFARGGPAGAGGRKVEMAME
ncbi:hypothetical protein HDU86_002522 [Geranomyces michiganensis]|nr:hypothetical protein HDU86_002522 [Geranomyces michiganensis]